MADGDVTPYGLVYVITNSVNTKRYVGQTTQPLERRWRQHLTLQGKCRALESALRRHGPDVFTIEPLAIAVDQDELNALEALHIEMLGTAAPCGYNLKGGGGGRGAMHQETREIMRALALRPERLEQFWAMRGSTDVKERMRIAQKENWKWLRSQVLPLANTPEARAKRSESMATAWTRPELRSLWSIARKQTWSDPQFRERMRTAMLKAWEDPQRRAAAGAALSAALKGHKKKIDHSDEAKARRSAVAGKRWADPAYRERMLARSADPEVVKKRGEAIRAGWARRRERLAADKAAQE